MNRDTAIVSKTVKKEFEKHFGYPPRVNWIEIYKINAYKLVAAYLTQHATTEETALPSRELSRRIGVRLSEVGFLNGGISPVKFHVVRAQLRYGTGEHFYWAPNEDDVQNYLGLLMRLG